MHIQDKKQLGLQCWIAIAMLCIVFFFTVSYTILIVTLKEIWTRNICKKTYNYNVNTNLLRAQ